jgi:hypothetical protein
MINNPKYVAPEFDKREFHCPYCGVFSHQYWMAALKSGGGGGYERIDGGTLQFCTCTHCSSMSIWHKEQMIVPDGGSAPMPHSDMPEDLQSDFNEARSIVAKSPRGAAALLRLVIQKLMIDLGEPGKDINADIGKLVKKGLSPLVQQALDTVRVVGNECVHPGTMDLRDDQGTAQALFQFVNFIIEEMIAKPNAVAALYSSLPKPKRDAIGVRDK